ncbi:putative histone-lysine N-methyltransferase ASHR1 [Blattamonas nauphoetae]|uniref:Histone-lysine N-methyltransferase ASHR1 n=1 Tax=Blattamonas nauphoetae TaxID=2049346 RepID=A0ABQ9Y9B7_9EUKA|nr:putative histone-lysine N-methyltransferase ASHR1 [Blattamonas nauphoetae]
MLPHKIEPSALLLLRIILRLHAFQLPPLQTYDRLDRESSIASQLTEISASPSGNHSVVDILNLINNLQYEKTENLDTFRATCMFLISTQKLEASQPSKIFAGWTLFDEYFNTLGRMSANSINGHDSELHNWFTGLYPFLSMTNHSCRPNCTAYFSDRGEVFLRAIKSITQGEEVTISYIDAGQPLWRRQHILNERFNFVCRCDRCKHEILEPQPSNSFKCQCGKALVSSPTAPHQLTCPSCNIPHTFNLFLPLSETEREQPTIDFTENDNWLTSCLSQFESSDRQSAEGNYNAALQNILDEISSLQSGKYQGRAIGLSADVSNALLVQAKLSQFHILVSLSKFDQALTIGRDLIPQLRELYAADFSPHIGLHLLSVGKLVLFCEQDGLSSGEALISEAAQILTITHQPTSVIMDEIRSMMNLIKVERETLHTIQTTH